MLVKDKKSGEIVGLRYGAAMDAVEAGTHEVVNEAADPAAPPPGPEGATAPPPPPASANPVSVGEHSTKADLEAEAAKRGLTVPSGATKADLLALLTA